MPDIGATFGYLGQGQAAFDLTGAARGFDRSPGLLSGLRLIDTVAGVVGVDRISGQLAKYAVKLALKGDQASLHAAQEMVELMRSRVPQDTGLLLNGITYRREGGFYVVEATADRGGYDYALAVEAGHHAGGTHADGDFFADTTGKGGRQVRQSQESDVPGQPFFYGSAREALSDWSSELGAGIGAAAREEGALMGAPTTFELALRDAIRTRLKADAAFQALAGKQIFDEVPSALGEIAPKVKVPYAYFGPIRRSNRVLDCSESWTIQARLYAVSTAFNRDQGWLLIDAMVASLDQLERPDLPLAEPYSLRTPLVVGQAGDVIDPLQAKSVFFDLTTTIARPLPAEEN